MQVDLSILSAVATGGLGLYAALLRYTINAKEREIERRLNELEATGKSLHNRLSDEEKATVRVESVRDALAEIKRDMVKRDMFDAQIEDMRTTQRQILSMLRATPGSYSQMSAVRSPPKPDPKR